MFHLILLRNILNHNLNFECGSFHLGLEKDKSVWIQDDLVTLTSTLEEKIPFLEQENLK